jgi:hypothetical protein
MSIQNESVVTVETYRVRCRVNMLQMSGEWVDDIVDREALDSVP